MIRTGAEGSMYRLVYYYQSRGSYTYYWSKDLNVYWTPAGPGYLYRKKEQTGKKKQRGVKKSNRFIIFLKSRALKFFSRSVYKYNSDNQNIME